jgi:hypothetical protein
MIRRVTSPPCPRWFAVGVCAMTVVGGAAFSTATAASAHDPVGRLESVVQTGTGVAVLGWAADTDTRLPLTVAVTVNGQVRARVIADVSRPDTSVARTLGADHGFSIPLILAPARDVICVVAVNRGAGSNHTIGCQTMTVSFDPRGSLDSVRQFPGGLDVVGGATDPNIVAAIDVDITVDNVVRGRLTANTTLHHGHGYSGHYLVPAGRHAVCAIGINRGAGRNAQIACRTITLNFSPVGAITALVQASGGIHLTGWAQDPDTSAPIRTTVQVDGATVATTTANLTAAGHGQHGLVGTYTLGGGHLAPGTYQVCVVGVNLGAYGSNRTVGCRAIALNFNPSGGIQTLRQKGPGIALTGWAQDPDTGAAITAAITIDGVSRAHVTANGRGTFHTLHELAMTAPTTHGTHAVCVVAINVLYGSGNGVPVCRAVNVNLSPSGFFAKATRPANTNTVNITGWAGDPDASRPVSVTVTVDGALSTTTVTHILRPDVVMAHPDVVLASGFDVSVPVSPAEHRVCLTALNQGGGSNKSLGCKIVNAAHPTVPSAPRAVKASAGYGQAVVSWTAPASDGGAPWTSYKLTVVPTGASKILAAGTTSTTVVSLKSATAYRFTIVATNVAGASASASSPVVRTQAGPAPQTTPAPISTSRYIRNITAASATEQAMMRREGAADAARNPSGHRYLVLLDIGGQSSGGVVLSATTRFVSYANLVRDVNAYVDGYASQQRASAPVTIAIGTNNDMDVSAASGASWAVSVVNPVAAHAAARAGLEIAGANDIEPGFRATYAQTRAWLSGYLGATHSSFVFNGSADGCAWAATARGCNNGWTMAGLYALSAGAAPTRIVNLPQIYNNTMAAQWKYISLTGVGQRQPRIHFGGALTEWTACAQVGGCGSLTGRNAWIQMWNQLQSHPALRPGSLPYSTDLRIDR